MSSLINILYFYTLLLCKSVISAGTPAHTNNYKLVYFDSRGRGEFMRITFAAAGQKFTDFRITESQWPGTFKAKTPWGTLPYLEVDGKVLGEAKPIIRFLGQRFGFLPGGDWEQALAGSIVEKALEIYDGTVTILFHTPESDKKNATNIFMTDTLPTIFRNMEKFITQYGSNGHVVNVGNKTCHYFALSIY
ncbi:glutathione S-transferase 1-like isoform X2 [Paramacrobiotus metropolitanus]|uniref:glutathione S-transferase 1-like isoform X2 n=1 Tax=Paramacrobiotus metropolitanus TaxID=2943436 RepID=UPI002445E23F|nr:glutathione S-transferase 1-like isoform X2 [Paramacrobiotus metropolitanus]